MDIKRKLLLSTCVTVAGLAGLATMSLVGLRFVQGKLAVLTERSTPYQLKTVELQRALQEHTANLLKVAVASTPADLAANKTSTEGSAAEVARLTAEVKSLTEARTGAEQDASALSEITRQMFGTTAARLGAQDAVRAADTALSARLQENDRRLHDLGRAMTALQKESARQLSAASARTREITERLMSLTLARDALKDLGFAVSEIQKAEGRKALLIARSKLDTAASEFAKNRLVAGNDPTVLELVGAVTEARKLTSSSGGLLDLKAALLAKTATDEQRQAYEQAAQTITARLAAATIGVEQLITTATDRYAQESRGHDASLRGSAGATDVAALNADLISFGFDISTQSRALFAARSRADLDRMAGEMGKTFSGAEAVRARLIKALEGHRGEGLKLVREVGDALRTVHGVLFDKDGARQKLHEVLKVEHEATQLNDRLRTLVAAQREHGKKGMTTAQTEQNEAVKAVNLMVQRQIAAIVAVGATVAVLMIVVSLLLARSITRRLGRSVRVLEAVADGDFTQKLVVDTRDEIGRMASAVNRAVEGMHDALDTVRTAARQTATASQQLSAASAQLSSGAQEQASSLEETAAALEEITGTVKQNAANARQANQLALGSRDVAEHGGQIVGEAVHSMAEINQASRRIADIITTIDEIAFQTNLLALNAAVEAARAGEQGRGFAVVASEVRNLAQRSATAAREIKGLIQDSVQKVEAGSERVNRSGVTLDEIVGSFKRVTDIIAEIAVASQEQSSGIDQVNKAVTQMDQVTQSNAAQTEELSSTAQSLATQAEQLLALVARFKLDGGDAPAHRMSVRAAAPEPIAAARAAGTTGALRPNVAKTHARKAELALAAAHAADNGFEEF
jgi:methyl-accepting chemotaxis protein